MAGGGKKHDLTAVSYMLAGVIFYSLVPLLFQIGNAADAPFLFNAMWKFFSSMMTFLFLFLFYKRFFCSENVRQLIWKSFFTWAFLLTTISYMGYSMFAWATQYIDIAIATILYDLWPIFFALYYSYKKSQKDESYKINEYSYLLMIFGFCGAGFAVISQYGNTVFSINFEYYNLIKGVSLSILAVLLVMLSAHGLLLAENLADEYDHKYKALKDKRLKSEKEYYAHERMDDASPKPFTMPDSDKREIAIYEDYTKNTKKFHFQPKVLFVIFGWASSNLIVCVLNVISSFIYGNTGEAIISNVGIIISYEFLLAVIIGGGIIHVAASIFWRVSNLLTKNHAINAIAYLTPILAVGWLWGAGTVNIQRWDYLFIGIIIIVVINILINFNASVRLGYKILILSLWSFGTIIYLYDGIELRGESYFNIIAIVSTLYILVLSFRLDRFVRRTSDEEQRALTLLENITKLITAKNLHRNARKFLMVIDSPNNVNRLRKSYDKIKTLLFIHQQRAHGNNSDVLVDKLAKIESEIEILAHSKQQGNNFGEFISLLILGAIVIGGLLFTYPIGLCGDEGIYVEIFAILLSTTVAFLLANIIDLQTDRNTPIMQGQKATKINPWRFGIVFRDLQDRAFERGISLVICAIIIGAYIVLLYHKWADMPCG